MNWNAIFAFLLVFASASVTAQNLQLGYVTRLLAMVSGDAKAQFDYLSQSAALQNLRDLENTLKTNPGVDAETRAHRANILYTIERGLDS